MALAQAPRSWSWICSWMARWPGSTRAWPVKASQTSLALYNLIFVVPPLLLLGGHVALGDRADAVLSRLRARLGQAAREGFLWLFGLVGFFLLADAVGHFTDAG